MNKKIHWTLYLLFIGTFIPFIDIIRVIKIETSPLAGFLGILIFLSYLMNKTTTRVNFPTFLTILLFIYMVVRVRLDLVNNAEYIVFALKEIISLLLGCMILISISIYGIKLDKKYIRFFIYLWLFIGLIQLSPFNYIIDTALKALMTRNSFSDEGSRGINMLANEPSYAGIYLVLFLVLLDYLKLRGEHVSKLLYCIVGLFLLLTFSSNALLLLMTYIVIKYLFSSIKLISKVISITTSCLLLLILINIDVEARSLLMLQTLLSEPSILLNDQSLSSRFYFIYISYYGLIESYFLGFGTGSYSINWMEIATQLNIISDVPQAIEIQRAFNENKPMMPMSFLGGIAHDLGIIGLIIFIIFIFYPVYIVRKNRHSKQLIDYVTTSSLIVFFLWLQTCSFLLPLPWFLIGLNFCLIKNMHILHRINNK